jgi:YVTN family beta-propeller protein
MRNLRRCVWLLLVLVWCNPALAQVGPFAYLTDAAGQGVWILDTATNTVVGNIPVPAGYGIAVDPSSPKAYVTNWGVDGVLYALDTHAKAITATVPVGSAPRGVAVLPDGSKVYVADQYSSWVSVLDAHTNTVIASIGVGLWPIGVAIPPLGTRVYVSTYWGNSVSVIDPATNTLIADIPLGGYPTGIACHPDGQKVYVAEWETGNLAVLDAATLTIRSRIPVGKNPFGVAVGPLGHRAYVSNASDNTVSVVDLDANAVITTVPVGSFPEGIDVHPDGRRVYVANSSAGTVSVIDTTTYAVTTIPVGVAPVAFGKFISPFLQVGIEIRPWSRLDYIIPGSLLPVPVAILSNPSFNATTQVDRKSLTFGRTGDEPSLAFCDLFSTDVNGDGSRDLVCFFNTRAAGFLKGDTQGVLKGKTKTGVSFNGADDIRILAH